MKKSFQFRIYPTKNQEVALNRTLSTCRHLYNDSLAKRKRQSELIELERTFGICPWGKPEWLNYYDQANNLSGSKTDFRKDVFSQVLQNVLKRVERSYKNFFNGFGYPRFQGRDRYNSFTYPQSGFSIKEEKLNLSKIGNIRIILHRAIEGTIKTCTVKKDIDHWYVTFSCEIDIPVIPVEIKTKTGIDVGLSSLTTMSNGSQIGHIVFEDLQVQNMVRNHHLAKSISKKDLSVRIHSCPFCGLVLDRDHNAAINILKRSISTVGTTGFQACLSNLKREAMKQDAPSPFMGE